MSEDEYSDPFEEPTVEICIETLTGTAFEMKMSPNDTVLNIKNKIQRVEGIPVQHQNLLYRMKELEDNSRLRDVGIKNGSVLKLVLSMRGGPISTRRLASCEHHIAWKDLKELIDHAREEILEKGSKISLFVFKEGDMVNLLRIIENEDGSYSPYAEKNEDCAEPTFKKILEDDCMLANMMKLREKMQNLSVRRQMRNGRSAEDDGGEPSTSSSRKEGLDSKCVGQKPLAYKLLRECGKFPDKVLQVHENSFETGEIALKEKHRTRSSLTAFPQESQQQQQQSKPKSLYSESKGSYSITKQKYAAKSPRGGKNSDTNFKEPPAPQSSASDAERGNVHFARLVLPENVERPKPSPKSSPDSLHLEEDAQDFWEIHDSTERLKNSATCKIGVLKRRQSVDYAFDTKFGVENTQNTDFEVFGRNFYQLPQLVSKEERMCDYIFGNGTVRRSPLYGRKPQNEDELKGLESGASNIERLRNDYADGQTEFEKDISKENIDSVCSLYNIACRSENAGLCLYSNQGERRGKTNDIKEPQGLCLYSNQGERKGKGSETKDLANEIKRIANHQESKVQTLKLESLPAVRKKQLRCDQCNRKLNLSNNYRCRCGRLFCAQHRYSEVHNCSHDYKTEGRLILERQNPLVVAEKLRKI